MGDYQHRSAARVVGWIDLVLKILQFFALIYLFIESAKAMKGENVGRGSELDTVLKDFHEKEMSAVKDALTVILWIVAIITVIQFIAAICLILATKDDRSPREALRLVKIWRGVTITYVVIGAIGGISMLKDGKFVEVLCLLIPIAFLFLVQPFLKELYDAV